MQESSIYLPAQNEHARRNASVWNVQTSNGWSVDARMPNTNNIKIFTLGTLGCIQRDSNQRARARFVITSHRCAIHQLRAAMASFAIAEARSTPMQPRGRRPTIACAFACAAPVILPAVTPRSPAAWREGRCGRGGCGGGACRRVRLLRLPAAVGEPPAAPVSSSSLPAWNGCVCQMLADVA